MSDGLELISPEWPGPPGICVRVTTRSGGVSVGPYRGLNLALHVGDDPDAVLENRRRLAARLPAEPLWLEQVHGVTVASASGEACGQAAPVADAAVAREPGVVCAVMTADCLPVVLASLDGRVVGVAHAGWRGLLAGVVEATIDAMAVPPQEVVAWLGPAIGPAAFEVGAEVREAFCAVSDAHASGFRAARRPGKWFADLFALSRQRLAAVGVAVVHGGGVCTRQDAGRFYSYRRDGVTGRFATLAWRES